MFPYKTSLLLERNQGTPLYLQLANQFIELIKSHRLPPKTKLPGSRSLSQLLNVHRKTVVACYEELLLQGWVESIPQKGTYIKSSLPVLEQQNFLETERKKRDQTNFSFERNPLLERKSFEFLENGITIDDGISDVRLTPLQDIVRTYRRISSRKSTLDALTYGSTYGNQKLREVLSDYLNETRGLQCSVNNILITRGSQMGIFLAAKLLLQEKDIIVVGETNYISADVSFLERKAQIKRVPVDQDGLNIEVLEELCTHQKIKAVYVTSHHHHPTTVTLSAERRIRLLNLAKEHQFAIIEDDYDYDYNYNHAPILPLASHDTHGNVIYIGSVCKTVAPVFRIGYLIAPKEFVVESANARRYVDRQGDFLLELAFADFIQSGDLDRHIKKTLKVYQSRRDLFCRLLKEELGDYIDFEIPKGGMAVWTTLKSPFTWKEVAEVSRHHGLEIGDWQRYDYQGNQHNSIRIGFASKNEGEIRQMISAFTATFKELNP